MSQTRGGAKPLMMLAIFWLGMFVLLIWTMTRSSKSDGAMLELENAAPVLDIRPEIGRAVARVFVENQDNPHVLELKPGVAVVMLLPDEKTDDADEAHRILDQRLKDWTAGRTITEVQPIQGYV